MGANVGSALNTQPVTERRQSARRSIEQQLWLLSFALNQVHEAIFLVDDQANFYYVNDAACHIYGYTRPELLNKRFLDIAPSWLEGGWEECWRKMMFAGSINFETEHKAKDGQSFPVEVNAKYFEYDGQPYLMALVRDITKRKQMEDQLRASELKFRTLVENSPDGIIRYDINCRRTYVNPGCDRTLVQSADYAMDKTLAEFWGGSNITASEYKSRLKRVMETGQPDEMMVVWQTVDGETICHSVRAVAEYGTDGKVIGAVAIGRNITALKETQRLLELSNQELKHLTSQRETARENERKYIAQEIHDELGQRLTALRMDIAMLRLQFGKVKPALGEQIHKILGSVDATLHIVRDVASRLRPAVLDMGINAALEWLVQEFVSCSIIRCKLDINVTDTELDEAQVAVIFRVVQESLTNVLRHSEAKIVEITLDKSADGYLLLVRDDGKGFDQELQRGNAENTSIGLFGMKERVLMLGGEFTVDSTIGRGTCIKVFIPSYSEASLT